MIHTGFKTSRLSYTQSAKRPYQIGVGINSHDVRVGIYSAVSDYAARAELCGLFCEVIVNHLRSRQRFVGAADVWWHSVDKVSIRVEGVTITVTMRFIYSYTDDVVDKLERGIHARRKQVHKFTREFADCIGVQE